MTDKGFIEADDIAKVADWAFRQGWKERARMQGVNKKALEHWYYEKIRIMLANKHYMKAFENKYLGIVMEPVSKKAITNTTTK